MKIRFNQPLPDIIRKVMTGFKALLVTVAGFTYMEEHKGLAFFLLLSGAVIDFLVDTFVGEHPLLTFERAAERVNQELPNTMVTYEVFKDDVLVDGKPGEPEAATKPPTSGGRPIMGKSEMDGFSSY